MNTPLASESPPWAAYGPVEDAPAPIIGDPALPLVSVVTPSFNQGRYLRDTIESVLGQGYPNLEYLVIDGGSADESLDVLRDYAGELRLRWLSEPDRGQSDAINKGWARCRGQVMAWLNSDDTYLPGAIAGQVRALLAHPEAGAVYADAQYTDAAGRPLTRLYGRPYSPLALLRLELPAQPTVFLRREIVARVGPISLGRRYSMDTDYWARAARLAPFQQVRALVATYRLHAESKTVGQFAGFYREWLAVAEAFFAEPGLPAELRAGRGPVLADIYAAMANLEARGGRPADALRYLAYALQCGGPRPRMLKLPLSLAERRLPLGLAARASAIWGRWRR
ncbi:glycosyltransferase, partial [Oscillochloris sp. ZM17-4]|uniref:glycosyltransferase family 2 protein n=1 Tax=Oscillochloris sp. ZM17-4 TaxID=2866714 RepID=UPI001C73DEC5